jgi:hypothetical protein
MSAIQQFMRELASLSPAEQSLLRQASGSLLSRSVPAFDLFTSIYWRLNRRGLDKQWLWLAMTLYPWNPLPDGKGCFGEAWALVRPRRDVEGQRRHDQRMDCILSAEPPVLDSLLLDALRDLKSRRVAIDWELFTHDLHDWCDAAAGVRQRWAELYLKAAKQGE